MYMLGPLLSMILILPVLCDGLTAAFSVWKGIKIRSALRPCKISSSSQSKAFKAPLLYWTQTYQIRWQSNLHKTRSLCNIIFVTLTCFYLTKKIEKTNSAGCKRTDANFHFQRHTIFQLFSSATLFIEGSVLTSSFPQKCVKWRQVKITNTILKKPKLFCRFDSDFRYHV